MADHDHLDERLRAANRVPSGFAHTEASRELMDEIRERIVAGGRPVERRRRTRRWFPTVPRGVVLGSVIGALAVGGAGAATIALTTYTGRTTNGWLAQAVGTGELLRVGAPGYCQAASKVAASVPYPASNRQPWQDWALLTDAGAENITLHQLCDTRSAWEYKADGGTGHTEVTTGLLTSLFTKSAFCDWVDQWLTAEHSADAAAASNAASEIAGALKWPVSAVADPDPGYDVPVPASAGVSPTPDTTTPLGWFIPAQKAVQARDLDEVSQLFSTGPTVRWGGQCTLYRPPVGSGNGTVMTPALMTPTALNGI